MRREKKIKRVQKKRLKSSVKKKTTTSNMNITSIFLFFLGGMCITGDITSVEAKQCVIVGSQGYEHFANAQRVQKRAQTVGLDKTAIYDTRDFVDLAYGQLAVIALMSDQKDLIHTTKKRLKAKSIPFYIRVCTPIKKPTPLNSKDDLRPHTVMPKTLMTLDLSKPLKSGCHGWSPTHGVAFCLEGQESWQEQRLHV